MKKIIILSGLLFTYLYLSAYQQVTIYNKNFSLVRKSMELNLKKGLQDYYLEDIPNTIEPTSVIVKSLGKKFDIFSQNYEYDLANTASILKKYIGKKIKISSTKDFVYEGILQFVDDKNIGLLNATTHKLNLIQRKIISEIKLDKLPNNFFLKPTLHWKLNAPKSGKYPMQLSYICSGMSWEATYNAVWNNDDNTLEINSWVTITNNSGTAFKDTKLKLMAGDINKIYPERRHDEIVESIAGYSVSKVGSSHKFTQKEFNDFHLYTLNKNVSINNYQKKQIQLFPRVTVTAKSEYFYNATRFNNKIMSKIVFKNSKNNNLGIPLPKGIVKVYKKDTDGNLEFIGEDDINHTPKDETVKLTIGSPFDLTAKTINVNERKISAKQVERDMKVILKNHSKRKKDMIVSRYIGYQSWKIINENVKYRKKDAFTVEFKISLKAGETFKLAWTEKIERY